MDLEEEDSENVNGLNWLRREFNGFFEVQSLLYIVFLLLALYLIMSKT